MRKSIKCDTKDCLNCQRTECKYDTEEKRKAQKAEADAAKRREARLKRCREYSRRYYAEHKDALNERKKAYREKNRERVNANQRRYYAEHKRELNLKRTARYYENAELRERIKKHVHDNYWAKKAAKNEVQQ